MASSGMDDPSEGVFTSENHGSSSSPKLDGDITTSTPDKALVNKHFVTNRRSVVHDLNDAKLILPSSKNDMKGRADCRARNRGASLPVPDFKKERKDRGPASCLFRGHDHSQRLMEEFDSLRNLQGKCLRLVCPSYHPTTP